MQNEQVKEESDKAKKDLTNQAGPDTNRQQGNKRVKDEIKQLETEKQNSEQEVKSSQQK